MGFLATKFVANRVVSTTQNIVVNLLGLDYGEMYKEPTDRFLPISSCTICSLLLLELSRGDGRDDCHCGSCLHLATVFCLYWNATQLNEKSSGK